MSCRASAVALLCAGIAIAGGVAYAQQASGLRGEVLEEDINSDLLGGPGQTPRAGIRAEPGGLSSPAYVPVTPGTGADAPTSTLADPVAERTAPQSLLADNPEPSGPAGSRSRPQTASERVVRPQTAAQRVERQPTGVATPRTPRRARPAPEEQLPAATIRAGTADSLDDDRNLRVAVDNPRVEPLEGLPRRDHDNAYAPLGMRLGSFIVTPTLEQGLSRTTNASRGAGGRPATLSETSLRLNAVSDWARHSAGVRADGTFRRSISGERISEAEGGIDGDLRLDLGGDFAALVSLGYRLGPESASSPIDFGEVTSQPLRHTLRGSVGLEKDITRVRLGLTGDIERNTYDDASLVDGNTLSQRDRDNTLATVRLRAGYEISPALRPFVEGEYGRRFHDRKRDAAGYMRSGNRYGMRVGTEFDMGEKLSGEVAAGWLTERPLDGRLRAVSGLALTGNVSWSPMRGTVVALDGTTEVEGATEPGASGSLLYGGTVSVSRELRHDLTARALLGLDWRDYSGSNDRDLAMRGELGLTWWMNRYAGITGRLSHERQTSTIAGRAYRASTVYLGMTLQR